MYPDPETFEPERFIEGGRLHTKGILDPFDYAFGFGRRYDTISRSLYNRC